ncbi:hypothetical protein D3C81_1589500 [compost metagenome]
MGVVECANAGHLKGLAGQAGVAVVDALRGHRQAFRRLHFTVVVIQILRQRQFGCTVFGADDTFVAVIEARRGDLDLVSRQRTALIEQFATRHCQCGFRLKLAFAVVQTLTGDHFGVALAGADQAAAVVELTGIDVQAPGNDFAVGVFHISGIELETATSDFNTPVTVVQAVDDQARSLPIGKTDQAVEVDDGRSAQGQVGLTVNA